MEFIRIVNNGELDVRLIALMGGTTKSKNKYKIGKFGTGLKYSIAWLLRNNFVFKIFSGEAEVKIDTERMDVGEEFFDVITVDGHKTSITTGMGMDWEAWMILRELWCNALDEGGQDVCLKGSEKDIKGEKGVTTIFIQNVGKIQEAYNNWNIYFLKKEDAFMDTPEFSIYPPSDVLRLYKNGVLIKEEKNQKTVFSYDIKNASINELRQYTGFMTLDVFRILKSLNTKTAEIFLNNVTEKHFEHDMDYNWGWDFDKSWSDALGQAKIITKDDYEHLKRNGHPVDDKMYVFVPKGMFKKLVFKYPHLSSVRVISEIESFHEVYDFELEERLKKALKTLEKCNYEVMPELKFLFGHFGDSKRMGSVNMATGEVMLSTEHSVKSLFEMICTVIEENEHFKTKLADMTREFQNHLMSTIATLLLKNNDISVDTL